jgi:hypothetical protein
MGFISKINTECCDTSADLSKILRTILADCIDPRADAEVRTLREDSYSMFRFHCDDTAFLLVLRSSDLHWRVDVCDDDHDRYEMMDLLDSIGEEKALEVLKAAKVVVDAARGIKPKPDDGACLYEPVGPGLPSGATTSDVARKVGKRKQPQRN